MSMQLRQAHVAWQHTAPPRATTAAVAPARARRSHSQIIRTHAVPAASTATLEASATTAADPLDPYAALGQLCSATGPVEVGNTARGRGLVLSADVPAREALLTVPLENALIIADEPTGGISIFSDKQHRRWQEQHGELPPLLLEFLQGDARWDARMAGWLLWMLQHPSPLWRSYLAMLPTEAEMCCLLNFTKAEIEELQVPQLQEEGTIQAFWCAHLHAKYFSTATGSLAPLRLSSSLQHSLWAISLVRSRTFSEDVNGEMLTLMVPYCDLANHATDNNSTFCISRDFKSFSLRSLRDVSRGEELTISYGAEKPNNESLRDYGFTLAGNSHDRIQWGTAKGAEAQAAEQDKLRELFGLNEACLMEAAGFSGDLEKQKDLQPLPSSQQLTPQQLARREAALLSMPLKTPGSSSSGGGLFGWLTEAAQPWTESGRPPPQPLQHYQAAAERAAVAALQQSLRSQLAKLPTSIQTDQQLLARLEASSGSNGSSGLATPPAPYGKGLDSSSGSAGGVQQRRHARLQQQQQAGAAPQPLLTALPADGPRPPSAARFAAAVRARLEHKLVLEEGLNVLQLYEQYLADKFGAV